MDSNQVSTSDDADPVAVGFVLRLAHALHKYGYSAQRLEDVLGAMSDRLGLHDHHVFSTPTSIMASFGSLGRQRTHMLRVEPGAVDLGKLAQVEHLAGDVARGRCTPSEGTDALMRIDAAPSRYGSTIRIVAFGLASAAACRFLGGGAKEILVGTVLGLALGIFSIATPPDSRVGRVFEPLAAFLVSAATIGLAHLVGPISVLIASLSGLIVLIPGLTLTTAMTELATRHLASGTARLSGAMMTFLGIAFGVALGNRFGAALFGAPAIGAPIPLGAWAGLIALVVAPLCFVVILHAEPRDAPWIVAVGAIGAVGGRLGSATLGVELGTFAGAFSVALAERLSRRPAAVVLVPGILMLVPGSLGFRSLSSMMERRAIAGIETAFSMFLTAIALVAGLLIAGVIVPERRVRDRTT